MIRGQSLLIQLSISHANGAASGTLLASGTFTSETASGWQELDFSTPVAIAAGTTYVVSYFTGTGHDAFTSGGLASAVTNGPMTALAVGGVYAYGSSNAFPTEALSAGADQERPRERQPPAWSVESPVGLRCARWHPHRYSRRAAG